MCVERQICGKMASHSPEVCEDCLSKVIVGRQRVGGVPEGKDVFCARVLHFEPRAVRFSLCERLNLQQLGQKQQNQASSSFFRRGTPPPICLLR